MTVSPERVSIAAVRGTGMSGASAEASTATVTVAPRAQLWGIGRYHVDRTPIDFPITWEDHVRDTAWAQRLLADHGVQSGSGVIFVAGYAESPWFDPFETAARQIGAPYSLCEVYPFDAFRVGLYASRLPIDLIFGITTTVVEGLGAQLAQLIGQAPTVIARPDAVGPLRQAGLAPLTVARVGPALAVECPGRSGAHVNGAEWSVREAGGELRLSTVGPRAYQIEDQPLGVFGEVATDRCGCGRTGPRVIFGS